MSMLAILSEVHAKHWLDGMGAELSLLRGAVLLGCIHPIGGQECGPAHADPDGTPVASPREMACAEGSST